MIRRVTFLLALYWSVFPAGGGLQADDPKPANPPSQEAEPEVPNVVRSAIPEVPPDPEELKNRPNPSGKLRFNFHGQPWPAVIEWLADVSHLSLDWQELPSGFVNLRTEREYSLDEARDLINRQLLDRGFTILKDGEILSVVPIKKLDPSLVPWVTPAELTAGQPHDFVRVVFTLDTLSAEAAAAELKSLLSPNGKMSALKSTNRIEAMDAVVNLRQIQKLLAEEQSTEGPDRQVREFKLKHVRASEVQQQLQKLLGLDKTSSGGSGQNADPAALVQQMTQLIQKSAGTPGTPPSGRPVGPPPVYIIADPRDNSILVHAPVEQMAVISQAVRMLDTPQEKSRSLLRDSIQTQVYTLTVADPDTVLKMLQELGDLDPATRLQVDRKRKAIVAQAGLSDQLRIRLLIDKVDGKARSFRVLHLHKVAADYVASAIDLVMGGGDGSKRPAGPLPAADDESRRFRVVADVEQNRLLLWVNDTEYEEVQGLLTELGETATPGQEMESATRVVDVPAQADPQELLRKLQEAWSRQAPNRLEPGPRLKATPARSADRPGIPGAALPATSAQPLATAHTPKAQDWWDLLRRIGQSRDVLPKEISKVAADEDAPSENRGKFEIIRVSQQVPAREKQDPAPPIIIDRHPDGRWTISSQDERAVELVKKLLGEIVPATGDFRVFRLKNKTASATAIAENLRQIFDQKQKVDKTAPRFFDPNSGKWISNTRETDAVKQTKPVPPRFIVDTDSNSILAVGADTAQLNVIEQVITLYDVPDSKDPLPKRTTRLMKIQHAQVRQLSDTVKEVYRDLLTANEPPQRPDQPRPQSDRFMYAYGTRDGQKGPLEMQVRFKGQLSISTDEPSNTLLVSAPDAILEDVVRTIESLDEAAAVLDQRVRVVRINRQINTQDFHKRLQRIGTRSQAGKSQGDNNSASGR